MALDGANLPASCASALTKEQLLGAFLLFFGEGGVNLAGFQEFALHCACQRFAAAVSSAGILKVLLGFL